MRRSAAFECGACIPKRPHRVIVHATGPFSGAVIPIDPFAMKTVILWVSLFAVGTGAVSHGLFVTRQKLDSVSAELREARVANLEAANRTVIAVDNVRLFLERDRARADACEKFDALQKQERDWTALKEDAEARNQPETMQLAAEKLAEIEDEQKRAWDSVNSLPLPADAGKRYATK
jgi:hypothetical protein